MNKTNSKTVQRREFLKKTAVAGVAVGSGAVTSQSLAASPDESTQQTEPKGYRETAHINEYYRLARF